MMAEHVVVIIGLRIASGTSRQDRADEFIRDRAPGSSRVRFAMVGLNVTHLALVTPEPFDFFCRTNDEVFGMPDGPLHDPVAVAVLADPGCVEVRRARLDVELTGTETAGATSVDLDGMLGRESNAWVAVALDVERFWVGVAASVARLA